MSNRSNLCLAPIPKKITLKEDVFDTASKRYIKIEADDPRSLLVAAKKTGLGWEITLSPKAPNEQVGLIIKLVKSDDIPAEGYKLTIKPEGMEITASTPAGAFYGACTLAQIIRNTNVQRPTPNIERKTRNSKSEIRNIMLPCLSISDSPDFPARGVMLDISRDKVPTMETLYHIVDLLADWKINQFQLYTEHTYAYLAHPKVWAKASPMTGEEIMALDAYCKERFIELVPNQNSFGHMGRWLKFDDYRHLAECPNGFDAPWGHFDIGTSLNPLSKKSIKFLDGLYDEFLRNFSSCMMNVGCDETWEVGKGESKSACEKKGVGRVYFDFLMEIYRLAKEHGRTMQFWGDIIMGHPELIPELPKDLIALEWGYEADHPFEDHCKKFAASGVPFYVCPGTSGWNDISGRTENAIVNITSAASAGLQNGAIGLLNTDWGDNGHWQPLSVSYLGYLVGAMSSWNAKSDVRSGLADALSLHAFGDPTGSMGHAFYDLGDIYRVFKRKTGNGNVPWLILFHHDEESSYWEMDITECEMMEQRLKDIAFGTIGEQMTCPDAGIIREEFDHLLRVLQLAAELGKQKMGGSKPKRLADRVDEIKMEHELVWLLRNRPGGLADSEANLKI